MTAPAPAPPARLATVASLNNDVVDSGSPQLRHDHAAHGCCLDPATPGYSLVASRPDVVDLATGEIVSRRYAVTPARCKSNGCRCCGPRNIRRNRKRAILGTREPGQIGLLTVTLDPAHPDYLAFLDATAAPVTIAGRLPKRRTFRDGEETRASIRFIGRGWSRFVTQARRIEPFWTCGCRRITARGRIARRHERGCTIRNQPLAEMAYARGLELQRNGRAHVHALVRVPDLAAALAMQEELRRLADKCGLGGRRRWRDGRGRLRSGFELEWAKSRREAAGYVTKAAGSAYAGPAEVAKAGQARQLPPRARRFAWSLGRRLWAPTWAPNEAQPGLTWSFARAGVGTVTRALAASDRLVDPAILRGPIAAVRAAEGVEAWAS